MEKLKEMGLLKVMRMVRQREIHFASQIQFSSNQSKVFVLPMKVKLMAMLKGIWTH